MIKRFNTGSEKMLLESILDKKDTIKKIVESIKKTTLYKKNRKKMITLMRAIRRESEHKNERVLIAAGHLLNKIGESPEKIHVESAIIMLMPVLKMLINELERSRANDNGN